MKHHHLIAVSGLMVLLLAAACSGGPAEQAASGTAAGGPAAAEAAPQPRRDSLAGGPFPALFLTQAQFIGVVGPDGKSSPQPGPAKLTILRRTGTGWQEVVVEDPLSNVFHEALPYAMEGAEPGILTIGANKAGLKIWRHSAAGGWRDETLWQPVFGGKWDRLRDLEVGDVTGDGVPELVIATHDQGVVAVARWSAGRWDIQELNRSPNTFVHEVEIGDVDGDRVNEFFVTPSEPNRAAGTSQPGEILMFKWNGSGFDRKVVEDFPGRHAKEILAADMNGDGIAELFGAIEAETEQGGENAAIVVPVQIKQYHFARDGGITSDVVATLNDRQCRFLCAGDVDGDGRKDLVAAAMKSGLWVLRPGEKGTYRAESIDADSSGFEHACWLADLDGDSQLEIYVAADDQREVRSYVWRGGRFERSVIGKIPADHITWNVTSGVF